MEENEKNISWIDYIKRKYDIDNLEDIISVFYLSLLGALIIYISFEFPIFHTTIIIFIVLLVSMFIINRYYENKYNKKIEFVRDKLKNVEKNIKDILENSDKLK